MSYVRRLVFLVLLVSLVLSACNLPRAGAATRTPTESVLTVAAKTVEAQLTMVAMMATSTPVPPTAPPTATPFIPTATSIPPTATAVYIPCDRALFIADVTVPDGAKFSPNQTFTKTWRLRNNGSCTWNTSYALIFDSGDRMGGPASVPMPSTVAPGQTVDLSVNLKAPASAGKYKGFWKLRNAAGATFGIGAAGNVSFWVEIEVVSPTATTPAPGSTLVYDFANNYCAAQWVSGAGVLPCPGTDADANGFVIRRDNPTLQNGTTYSGRALQTHPQWVDDGVITGKFPPLDVEAGWRFQTTLGCLNGGAACDVIFQLNYRADGGPLQSLGQWNVKYADAPKVLNIDVSSLAGKSVEFVLAVTANGSPVQDWAIWFKPVIVK